MGGPAGGREGTESVLGRGRPSTEDINKIRFEIVINRRGSFRDWNMIGCVFMKIG